MTEAAGELAVVVVVSAVAGWRWLQRLMRCGRRTGTGAPAACHTRASSGRSPALCSPWPARPLVCADLTGASEATDTDRAEEGKGHQLMQRVGAPASAAPSPV